MLREYIQAALDNAKYEMIRDEEPFYGEIAGLPGVWATGKTLEECRKNLADVLDSWILFRLSRGMEIPPVGGVEIRIPKEIKVA